jgi:CBS domain-containing protein
VDPAATVDGLIAAAAQTRHGVIPVIEAIRDLIGLITHHAPRAAIIARGDLARLLLTEDFAEPVEMLQTDQSFREARADPCGLNVRRVDHANSIRAQW